MFKIRYLISVLASMPLLLVANSLPEGCQYGKACTVEVPEAICADGSPSYIQLFIQKNSPSLVIYLEPGGACWNEKTCTAGYVLKLSRKAPKSNLHLGERGILDLDNPQAPLFGFSQATIPYCTGDVYLGDNVINYGTLTEKKVIRHQGYSNVLHSLKTIQSVFPHPEKVLLLGRSAGGLGVLGHIKSLNTFFPDSAKFALSDAGTPLMPPYVNRESYNEVIDHWNALGALKKAGIQGIQHFGDLMKYNTLHFPHVRFGLIQSYEDRVMQYFASAMGAEDPNSAVALSSLSAWRHFLGPDSPHAKVFFNTGATHIHTRKPLTRTQSMNVDLLDWLKLMLSNSYLWENIMPQL